jgi:hypothetical protein
VTIDLEVVNDLNRCTVAELERLGDALDPQDTDSCSQFGNRVFAVQAALVQTYRIIAHVATREAAPDQAAELWRQMEEFCDQTLNALRKLKAKFPYCGTPQLYDLALEYRLAASKRYQQNLQDAECLQDPIPAGLFPKTN